MRDETVPLAAGIFDALETSILATDPPHTRLEFARHISGIHVALNGAHPFRDGNRWTQRVFLYLAARDAGFEVADDVIQENESVARSRVVSCRVSLATCAGWMRFTSDFTLQRRKATGCPE